MVRLQGIARALACIGAAIFAEAAFSENAYQLNFPDRFNGAFEITGFRTTLVVPDVPKPEVDSIVLWPGVQAGPNADGVTGLTQSIIGSFRKIREPAPSGCGGVPGQWCAFTYQYVNHPPEESPQGTTVPVNVGAPLDIEYTKEGPSYRQTISLDGKVISEMARDNHGPGTSFYTAAECHYPFNNDFAAHQYLDTTITLSNAQPDFNETVHTTQVDATPLTSPDGGKTWKVARIEIRAGHCDASKQE